MAKPLFGDDEQMANKLLEEMGRLCLGLCYRAMQFDRRIVTWKISCVTTSFMKCALTFSFRAVTPEVKYALVDGERRRSYRVGFPVGEDEIYWCELEASVLGLPPGEPFPLYVQSHTIDRIRSRLQSTSGSFGFFVFGNALCSPHAVRTESGETLLEAKSPGGRRIGYFPVESVDGVALVKTFLFLTMEGTPESERLYQMLGTRRRDIVHLGLDKLETFLKPDVAKDKKLAEIFEECGCGQLFELRSEFISDDELDDEPDSGDAKEIKAYLAPSKAFAWHRQKAPQGIRASDLGLDRLRLPDW